MNLFSKKFLAQNFRLLHIVFLGVGPTDFAVWVAWSTMAARPAVATNSFAWCALSSLSAFFSALWTWFVVAIGSCCHLCASSYLFGRRTILSTEVLRKYMNCRPNTTTRFSSCKFTNTLVSNERQSLLGVGLGCLRSLSTAIVSKSAISLLWKSDAVT